MLLGAHNRVRQSVGSEPRAEPPTLAAEVRTTSMVASAGRLRLDQRFHEPGIQTPESASRWQRVAGKHPFPGYRPAPSDPGRINSHEDGVDRLSQEDRMTRRACG